MKYRIVCLKMFSLQLARTCEETYESVWPPNARYTQVQISSTSHYLRFVWPGLNAPFTLDGNIWKIRFHFENASNIFSPHYVTPEEFDNVTAIWKAPFSKCLRPTLKQKAGVFKFLRFEVCLLKASFTWWISVDGRSCVEIKLCFHISLA